MASQNNVYVGLAESMVYPLVWWNICRQHQVWRSWPIPHMWSHCAIYMWYWPTNVIGVLGWYPICDHTCVIYMWYQLTTIIWSAQPIPHMWSYCAMYTWYWLTTVIWSAWLIPHMWSHCAMYTWYQPTTVIWSAQPISHVWSHYALYMWYWPTTVMWSAWLIPHVWSHLIIYFHKWSQFRYLRTHLNNIEYIWARFHYMSCTFWTSLQHFFWTSPKHPFALQHMPWVPVLDKFCIVSPILALDAWTTEWSKPSHVLLSATLLSIFHILL